MNEIINMMSGSITEGSEVAGIATFVLTCTGGLVHYFAVRKFPQARACRPLYQLLFNHRKITAPIINYDINPYTLINPNRALIVQGASKIGKTTLFATSIPWYRRRGPLRYDGIVFNGAEFGGTTSFSHWLTSQMQGITTHVGSGAVGAISSYNQRQVFRRMISSIPYVGQYISLKPSHIIIDQFEDLLLKYPVEALKWANSITNKQCRDHECRVYFIVNSELATKALLNLNQGLGFDAIVLSGSPDLLPSDKARFIRTQCNIGLYKETMDDPYDELDGRCKRIMYSWVTQHHISYSPNGDRSWEKVPVGFFKHVLLKAVEKQLASRTIDDGIGNLIQELSSDDVQECVQIVANALKDLSKEQIRLNSKAGWLLLLQGTAIPSIVQGLAEAMMITLSTPISTTSPSADNSN